MRGVGRMTLEYQKFVNHIIYEIYLLPVHQRTTSSILHIVHEKQQEIGKNTFFKSGCDYIAFAQIIDHLLQQTDLYQDKHAWYCPLWKGVNPSNRKTFRLDHTVISHENKQVRFRKFFVECSSHALEDYARKAILCSEHMFQAKPTSVEYVNLTTGEHHILNVA